MKFEDSVAVETAVVCVEGRVDATNANLLDAHCKQHMADHGRKSLVLDLAGVDYLSSAGLRSILTLGKHTQAVGGKLVLCGIQGTVKEIFEISGFLSLFPVADDMEKAVRLALA